MEEMEGRTALALLCCHDSSIVLTLKWQLYLENGDI
jgi:hypothetical protein